jgi:putative chitinase
MPGAPDLATWTDILNSSMEEFAIDSPPRMAAFLAQVAHESAELHALAENLNYSAAGLRSTWPKRFRSVDMARSYERQPERIANFVYANRLGNGDEASGDGWRFRGRGLLQVTGRSHYRSTGTDLGLPLEDQPELLEQPEPAGRSAGLFWSSTGLNELADLSGDQVHDDEDFILITKRINGGIAGLANRKAYWTVAKGVLGVV